MLLLINNGQGQIVIASDNLCSVLAVIQRVYRDGWCAIPDFGQQLLGFTANQVAQGDDKLKLLFIINHVNGISSFFGVLYLFDVVQCLFNRPIVSNLRSEEHTSELQS